MLNTSIRKKGFKVKVFTSSFQRDKFVIANLRRDSKEYFGKSNTAVSFSSDKKLIHERAIAFGNVVVECNHDFAEIRRENRNWKLDVTICSDLSHEIKNKCLAYS